MAAISLRAADCPISAKLSDLKARKVDAVRPVYAHVAVWALHPLLAAPSFFGYIFFSLFLKVNNLFVMQCRQCSNATHQLDRNKVELLPGQKCCEWEIFEMGKSNILASYPAGKRSCISPGKVCKVTINDIVN